MIDVELTQYELRDLKSFAAGNPIPSSSLHSLSDKGLLVFDATIARHYRLTPTGTAFIEREKQQARERMDAITAAARAGVKPTAEPTVKYTSMVQSGLMKEEIKLEKMSDGIMRIYFPHKPHWKVRRALEAARFTYWGKADYWSRQDDDTALKFIQDWLSHDIYVGDDDETPETQQKPVQTPKQPLSDHAHTMALQADAYVCGLEIEATRLEMLDWMGEFNKRYRLATKVMELINMNLWREVAVR